MKYEGNKDDLFQFVGKCVSDLWVIKMDGKTYKMDCGQLAHGSYNRARRVLISAMKANFYQGHYWHKGKDNTFEHEGGQMRLDGVQRGLDVIFDPMAEKFVDQALKDGLIVIEKIN